MGNPPTDIVVSVLSLPKISISAKRETIEPEKTANLGRPLDVAVFCSFGSNADAEAISGKITVALTETTTFLFAAALRRTFF